MKCWGRSEFDSAEKDAIVVSVLVDVASMRDSGVDH